MSVGDVLRFSASRLGAYMTCSLSAHYRYDEGLPRRQNAAASFGTVMHEAFALYYESAGDFDKALRHFKSHWAKPSLSGVEPDYWPRSSSFGTYMKKGVDALEALHEAHRWSTFVLIGTEVPFLVPFGEYELTGFVDLLGIEKSGTGKEILKIVDHKTASREPSETERALDIQHTVYNYATRQREFWVGAEGNVDFPGLPNGEWLWETVGRDMTRRSIWHAVSTGRELDCGPRTDVDFGRLYRVCDEIKRAIEAQVFIPKIGTACTWCDFVERCSMEIPVSIKAAADADDPERWL
jgi:hypothetical protein